MRHVGRENNANTIDLSDTHGAWGKRREKKISAHIKKEGQQHGEPGARKGGPAVITVSAKKKGREMHVGAQRCSKVGRARTDRLVPQSTKYSGGGWPEKENTAGFEVRRPLENEKVAAATCRMGASKGIWFRHSCGKSRNRGVVPMKKVLRKSGIST